MRNKRLSTQLDHWQQRPIGVGPMNTWLRDQGSLTKRLKARYADFSVKVMATKISRPASDEAKILGIANGRYAYVRQVLLIGARKPVVFAHTVMPLHTIRRGWTAYSKQGTKPLGESLFTNPKIKRSLLSYQRLNQQHVISKKMHQSLLQYKAARPTQAVWARRSLFSSQRIVSGQQSCLMQMLVTEVFLTESLMQNDASD